MIFRNYLIKKFFKLFLIESRWSITILILFYRLSKRNVLPHLSTRFEAGIDRRMRRSVKKKRNKSRIPRGKSNLRWFSPHFHDNSPLVLLWQANEYRIKHPAQCPLTRRTNVQYVFSLKTMENLMVCGRTHTEHRLFDTRAPASIPHYLNITLECQAFIRHNALYRQNCQRRKRVTIFI